MRSEVLENEQRTCGLEILMIGSLGSFSIKINGYFVIFLYVLILKQKSVLKRSKQAANLVEKNGEFVKQDSWDYLMSRSQYCFLTEEIP